MSPIKRTKHAVYDLKYHLVWCPKYRKKVFTKEIEGYAREIFKEIAEQYELEIDEMEVAIDHVHIFLVAPPRYSPAQLVQILKSISARELFKQFPKLKKQLWAGELWNDGYFARTVGDKVTSDVIRKYIKYHHNDQLDLGF
jgi:putative transposase